MGVHASPARLRRELAAGKFGSRVWVTSRCSAQFNLRGALARLLKAHINHHSPPTTQRTAAKPDQSTPWSNTYIVPIVSPMQSDKPKRDLADFFKPYARHFPPSTIPRKRSSPSTDRSEQQHRTSDTKFARVVPKTPVRTVSFKDVTPSPKSTVNRSIFSPKSEGALPIRSPRTVRSRSDAAVDSKQRTLFQTLSPPKPLREDESKIKSDTSFSFSDISERSHSVTEDGKVVAVRDSDEDDSDSILSLDHILGRRTRDPNPKSTAAADSSFGSSQDEEDVDNEAERISILSKFTRGRSVPIVGKEKVREFYAKQKQLKFDLSMILDDHFGDLEAMEKARQARMESDSEDEDNQELTETDKKLLADVVLNGGEEMDGDDVNRVLSAMERTEALAGDRKFSFFNWRCMKDCRAQMKSSNFPAEAIPSGLWTRDDDEDKRDRTFLSGIMIELAAAGSLSEQALNWIFWESLREQQPGLQEAYKRTVQAGSQYYTRLHVSASDVQHVFEMLGAASDVLQINGPISLKRHIVHGESSQNSAHLLVALELFHTISLDLDMSALGRLASIILRLGLDETVMSDGRAAKMVVILLESLLDHPNHDARTYICSRLMEDSIQQLHDPVLQARHVSQIPATSDAGAILRRNLAIVFLLGESILHRPAMTSEALLNALNKQINKHPIFTITRKPHASPDEYAALTALTTILDTAIGSGEPPALRSKNVPHDTNPVPRSYIHNSVLTEKSARIFNASVDALADSIHSIFVSIKDTGASHMRRTEAKDALQALEYRCLYSVRHGVRKKKHVFDIVAQDGSGSSNPNVTAGKIVGIDGDEYRERERAKAAMSRFLSKVRSQKREGSQVQSTNGDGAGGHEDDASMDTSIPA